MSSSETSSITSSSSSSTGLDSDSYGLSSSSSSSSTGSDSDRYKKRKSKHRHKHRHKHKSKKHRSKHRHKHRHKHKSSKKKRSSSATRKKDRSSRSRRSDKKVSKRSQSARRVKAVKLGSSSKFKKDKLALLIPKDNDEKEEKEKKLIKKRKKEREKQEKEQKEKEEKEEKKKKRRKKKRKKNKEKKKNIEIEITKESKKSKDKKKKRPFQYHETELQEGTKLFRECEEWVIEVGREGADPTEFDKVQNIQYFFDKFYGNEYMLVGIINEISGHHLVLAQELANKNETEFLVLIINENKNQLLTIKKKELDLKFYSSNKTEKALKKMFLKYDKEAKGEVKIVDMDYEDEESSILEMENATIHTTFKVGVLCIKEGQKEEEEFFQNRYESYDFKQFLKILGEKIRLKGFKKYGGRLDTKEDADGTHAIYSQYKNNQIMYHVLTWLPFDKIDDQQVCRKRHIGNDNVVIVFIEGNVKFLPKSITSQQNHVVIAVRAEHPPLEPDKTLYRVEVARKNTVEDFKPYLPNPPIFREEELRDFLLSKIVSGDRTIQRSGIFQRRMMNFRKEQILDMFESYEEK